MNRKQMKKIQRQVIRSTCQDIAVVFRKGTVRNGTQWVEQFLEVQRGAAHFYSTDTSDSEKMVIRNGKETYTPMFKVRLMDFDVQAGDRIVPIVDGKTGGRTGKGLFEVANEPVDPSLLGVCLEAPVESMEQPYTIEANAAGKNVLVMKRG